MEKNAKGVPMSGEREAARADAVEGQDDEAQAPSQSGDAAPQADSESVANSTAGRSTSSRPLIIAALVVLGGVLVAYALWQQHHATVQRLQFLEQQLDQVGGMLAQQQRLQGEQLRRFEQRLDKPAPELARALAQLEQQLQSLRGQLPGRGLQWDLAEVDYLLRLAEHRLQLERHPASALNALTSAAAILAQLDHPQLAPLRHSLAQDIERLSALNAEDAQRAARRLEGLITLAAQLRPKSAAQSDIAKDRPGEKQPVEASGWQRFFQQLRDDLRGLVVIRKPEDGWQPPAEPYQQHLQWILQLRLESARLALLAAQQPAWQEALAAAQHWLTEHFDARSEAWLELDGALVELGKQQFWPDASGVAHSIELLEQLLDDGLPAVDAAPSAQAPGTAGVEAAEQGNGGPSGPETDGPALESGQRSNGI